MVAKGVVYNISKGTRQHFTPTPKPAGLDEVSDELLGVRVAEAGAYDKSLVTRNP
jgi:hypothetical protein